MKKVIIITCLSVLPLTGFAAEKMTMPEEQSKFGITAKLGTLGAGLDLTFKIHPKFNARLNANGANATYDEVDDGIAYKGDLKLSSIGALLDYHPFENGFRLSGGLYSNSNKIEGSSTDAQNADIGDVNYNIVGTLNSKVGFEKSAPYLGLGWGNAVSGYKNFNFSIDAGVLFQGSPNTQLSGTGTATPTAGGATVDISNDAAFLAELEKEETNLNNDLKDFKYYPVISMGVSYNF